MEFSTYSRKKISLLIVPGPHDVGSAAAEIIKNTLKKKSRCVLGFATGSTTVPLYRELVGLYKRGVISFRDCICFTLDEYRHLPPIHRRSLRHFMEKNLFSRVDIPRENIHYLNGAADDPERECRAYGEEIRRAGGIDVQILGIGFNGHIGYNEPGSSRLSRTRMVMLSEETRARLRPLFGQTGPPRYALTMGVATILSAKRILLLAAGRDKSRVIDKALREKPAGDLPASFLQTYPGPITVILDTQAARLLPH